jgi:hypothetical protein
MQGFALLELVRAEWDDHGRFSIAGFLLASIGTFSFSP